MRQLALIPLLLILVSCSRSPGAVGLGGGTGDPGVRTTSNNTTAIERDLKRNEEIEAGIDKRATDLDKALDLDQPKSDASEDPTDVSTTPPSERELEREKEKDDLLKDLNDDSSAADSESSSNRSF